MTTASQLHWIILWWSSCSVFLKQKFAVLMWLGMAWLMVPWVKEWVSYLQSVMAPFWQWQYSILVRFLCSNTSRCVTLYISEVVNVFPAQTQLMEFKQIEKISFLANCFDADQVSKHSPKPSMWWWHKELESTNSLGPKESLSGKSVWIVRSYSPNFLSPYPKNSSSKRKHQNLKMICNKLSISYCCLRYKRR